MYSVSNDYKAAAKAPVQVNTLTFTLGGQTYGDENILEGSFSITNQCTDTADVTLGAVYTAELTATLRGIDIARNEWNGKVITPYFNLQTGPNTFEAVPLGVFTIAEATWTKSGVDVTAYDNMAKFDKPFSLNQANGRIYDFLLLAAEDCHVTLAQTEQEIAAMPNGSVYLTYYSENDVETWRDLIYWLAQTTGGFATINRSGQLEIRHYTTTAVDTIDTSHREKDGKFSDYITKYTAISFVDLRTQETRRVAAAQDDGITLNFGVNPFLQNGTQALALASALLTEIAKISYTPYKSATIGNPAFDLGDVLEFTGGIAGTESLACVMQYTFNYHRKFEVAGFGANPALASAKSKIEKNISGLVQNAKGEMMNFYEFRNVSDIHVGNQEKKQVARLKIAASADTRVDIHININLETESALMSGKTQVKATYLIDAEEALLHPEEIYIDGKHVLHLMYILPLAANIICNFRVYLEADGGTIDIERRGLWMYASGYGIAGDGSWDGTIDPEDYTEPFTIYEIGFDDDITETVSISLQTPTKISASDTAAAFTIEEIGFEQAQDRLRLIVYKESQVRTTEDGTTRTTERTDPNAEVEIRTTEEES